MHTSSGQAAQGVPVKTEQSPLAEILERLEHINRNLTDYHEILRGHNDRLFGEKPELDACAETRADRSGMIGRIMDRLDEADDILLQGMIEARKAAAAV